MLLAFMITAVNVTMHVSLKKQIDRRLSYVKYMHMSVNCQLCRVFTFGNLSISALFSSLKEGVFKKHIEQRNPFILTFLITYIFSDFIHFNCHSIYILLVFFDMAKVEIFLTSLSQLEFKNKIKIS